MHVCLFGDRNRDDDDDDEDHLGIRPAVRDWIVVLDIETINSKWYRNKSGELRWVRLYMLYHLYKSHLYTITIERSYYYLRLTQNKIYTNCICYYRLYFLLFLLYWFVNKLFINNILILYDCIWRQLCAINVALHKWWFRDCQQKLGSFLV